MNILTVGLYIGALCLLALLFIWIAEQLRRVHTESEVVQDFHVLSDRSTLKVEKYRNKAWMWWTIAQKVNENSYRSVYLTLNWADVEALLDKITSNESFYITFATNFEDDPRTIYGLFSKGKLILKGWYDNFEHSVEVTLNKADKAWLISRLENALWEI